jgi:8-oxo-dGTP pyrophosphatase MutT (NUDIX family)
MKDVTIWDFTLIERALREHRPRSIARETVRAAVALILGRGVSGIKALFIRRAEHPLDPWSGHIAFPGGRREPGDADLCATAIRETQEELGLDLTLHGGYVGQLDEIETESRPRGVDLSITPFVFLYEKTAPLVISAEVQSVHWIALDALSARRNESTMMFSHEGRERPYPAIRVGDHVIWGLTYRMLRGFEEVVRASSAGVNAALQKGR